MGRKPIVATLLSVAMVLSVLAVPVMAQSGDTSATISADDPTIHRVSVGGTGNLDVDLSTPVTLNISHGNGLDNLTEVQIVLYRNTTTATAADNLRDHYTITYDVSADTVSANPTINEGSVSVADGLDTTKANDTLTLDINLEDYAAPSQGVTTDTVVNTYNWQIDASATDNAASGGDTIYNNSTTTEVPMKTGYTLNASSISVNADPGTDAQFSPDIQLTNDGNVEQDLGYSATNLTSDATSDKITVDNIVLDDDGSLDEGSETGTAQSVYQTSDQSYSFGTSYNSDSTVFNWVRPPMGIDSVQYTGNFTYAAKESGSS